MSTRRRRTAGNAVITIDIRNPDPTTPGHHQETAQYVNCRGVVALLSVLQELCGPEADVFFDFGVITVREVDLDAFAERLAGS